MNGNSRKFLGVMLLTLCAALVVTPVLAGFSMAGIHVGLVLITGLGGILCLF